MADKKNIAHQGIAEILLPTDKTVQKIIHSPVGAERDYRCSRSLCGDNISPAADKRHDRTRKGYPHHCILRCGNGNVTDIAYGT